MFDHQKPVVIKSAHMKDERLSVEYPVVHGLVRKEAEEYINSVIYSIVTTLIVNSGYYEDAETEVTGTYHIRTNEKGILSVSIEMYWFSGGAHGMTVIKSVTFNVKSGKVYRLGDLFTPGSDYVRRLSGIIMRQIKERDIPLLVDFTGIAPNQDYYIEGKTLNIYFQLYELAAYVYGFLTFPIPYGEIEDIVSPKGPLGILHGSP